MRRGRLILTWGLAVSLAACSVELPEPDSPGARILTARCGGCHRLYPPGVMTFSMWEMQFGRMRTLFAQRGIPWLPPDEERVLLDYLRTHAGTQ
jgi:hypothetical protein